MPRRKQNKLQLGVRADGLPRGTKQFQYFRGLLTSLDTGSDLPKGWDVKIRWRNPDSGRIRRWQEDDFVDAISNSNAGFSSALRRMLTTYLYRARFEPKRIERKPVIRKRAVVQKFERMLESVERSKAAKRGWKTRRANERKRTKKRKW